MLTEDDSFRFLEGVNFYKWIYKVSIMLEIYSKFFIFFLFDVGDDSKSNYFEKRGNDVILATTSKDPLGVSIKPILRPKMKWI